jgi:acyl-homoserine-lactone acylase
MPSLRYPGSRPEDLELTPAGPRARTLLTYGQSSNALSPFHTDQARLYSAKQWIIGRFTAAEIARDPGLRLRALPG